MAPSPQPVAVAVLLLALRLPLCNTQQARGGGPIAAAPSAFRVPSAGGAARVDGEQLFIATQAKQAEQQRARDAQSGGGRGLICHSGRCDKGCRTCSGDALPITISCPAELHASADPGKPFAKLTPQSATAATPRSPGDSHKVSWPVQPSAMPTDFQVDGVPAYAIGRTKVTYEVIDKQTGGVTASCDTHIEILDTEAPALTCPPALDNATMALTLLQLTANITAIDNSGERLTPTCLPIGRKGGGAAASFKPLSAAPPDAVHCSAKDSAGNAAQCIIRSAAASLDTEEWTTVAAAAIAAAQPHLTAILASLVACAALLSRGRDAPQPSGAHDLEQPATPFSAARRGGSGSPTAEEKLEFEQVRRPLSNPRCGRFLPRCC